METIPTMQIILLKVKLHRQAKVMVKLSFYLIAQ